TRGTAKTSRRPEKTRWPGVFTRGKSFVVLVTIDGRKLERSAPTAEEAMARRDGCAPPGTAAPSGTRRRRRWRSSAASGWGYRGAQSYRRARGDAPRVQRRRAPA